MHLVTVEAIEIDADGAHPDGADEPLDASVLGVRNSDAAADARAAELFALHDSSDDAGHLFLRDGAGGGERFDKLMDDGRLVVGLNVGLDRGDIDEVGKFHNRIPVTRCKSLVIGHSLLAIVPIYEITGGDGGSRCLCPTARCSFKRSLNRRSWFSIFSIAPSRAANTVPASSTATNSSWCSARTRSSKLGRSRCSMSTVTDMAVRRSKNFRNRSTFSVIFSWVAGLRCPCRAEMVVCTAASPKLIDRCLLPIAAAVSAVGETLDSSQFPISRERAAIRTSGRVGLVFLVIFSLDLGL